MLLLKLRTTLPSMLPLQNPWFIIPTWQNFSSMYRESVSASESKTGMERAHHLTAALYFGIAALEAFINEGMRKHLTLTTTLTDDEITERLRKGKFGDKLKKWPKEIFGKSLPVDPKAMAFIWEFVEVRHNLTHPKTRGHDVYRRLDTIDPTVIVSTVAEYIVRYYEGAGSTYPYWVFGWNYLNPRPDSYEIIIIHEQQFTLSLQMLGIDLGGPNEQEATRARHLGSFAGYREISDGLAKEDRCAPKQAQFPHAPVLCRRWWAQEHQKTCGCVTEAALQRAMDIDNAYAKPGKPQGRIKGWLDRMRGAGDGT